MEQWKREKLLGGPADQLFAASKILHSIRLDNQSS